MVVLPAGSVRARAKAGALHCWIASLQACRSMRYTVKGRRPWISSFVSFTFLSWKSCICGSGAEELPSPDSVWRKVELATPDTSLRWRRSGLKGKNFSVMMRGTGRGGGFLNSAQDQVNYSTLVVLMHWDLLRLLKHSGRISQPLPLHSPL